MPDPVASQVPNANTPMTLGDYRIIGRLGQGGMGEVFKAEQKSLRRIVAVKVLAGSHLAGPDARSRFLREGGLIARLTHPYIVPVYEAGDQDGVLYYAMEYVQGQRLDDYVTQRHLRLRQTVEIMLKVCEGVQAAHQRGIIHRDLKPANILVDASGNPRLLDFGLAKILTDGAAEFSLVTMDGDLMGTPAYMAPEQTLGRMEAVDVRSDVYALGVVLYKLTTGHLPHQMRAIQQEEPVAPRRRVRGIPVDLEAIILKALRKQREHRYQSAGELAADLKNLLTGHPVAARRPTAAYRFWRLVLRNKAVSAVLAASIVAVVGLTGLFILRLQRERLRAEEKEREASAKATELKSALSALRDTAPTLYTQSGLMVERYELPQALEMVTQALVLMPDKAEYLRQKGNILQTLLRFDEAAGAYAAALGRDPKCPHAQANRVLCHKLAAESQGKKEPPAGSLPALHQAMLEQERFHEAAIILRRLKQGNEVYLRTYRPILEKAGYRDALTMDNDSSLTLDLSGQPVSDLSFLKGLPLSRLDLGGTPVTDLRPLLGMPLGHLSLAGTKVTDLQALTGMPLTHLVLNETRVRDLGPLAGMPLQRLYAGGTQMNDIRPLTKMPLVDLNLSADRIEDLGPLAGMPLVTLNPGKPANVDLSPLAGMRLERLTIEFAVRDLRPLQGMPLRFLEVQDGSRITDISPLAGMPLETLILYAPNVGDLRVLKGMPLKVLALGCAVPDLTPLASCTQLEDLRLPIENTDIESLRKLPKLERINGKQWTLFWKEHDAAREREMGK
jgi:tetratricopeptide (TPR) repeat protein